MKTSFIFGELNEKQRNVINRKRVTYISGLEIIFTRGVAGSVHQKKTKAKP